MRTHLFVVALCTLLAACADEGTPPPSTSELVATRGTVFGAEDGQGALSIVFDVDVSSDGRVYASEPGFSRVVVFASDGSFLTTIGRRGEGPGEFQVPGNLSWLGDTLTVLDFQLGISLLDRDREFFERISFAVQGESQRFPLGPILPLNDGSVGSSAPAVAADVLSGRIQRETWLKMSRDGAVLDTLLWRAVSDRDFDAVEVEGRSRSGSHPLSIGELMAMPLTDLLCSSLAALHPKPAASRPSRSLESVLTGIRSLGLRCPTVS